MGWAAAPAGFGRHAGRWVRSRQRCLRSEEVHFPETLIELHLTDRRFRACLANELKLPPSLTVLHYYGLCHPVQDWRLPAGLKKLDLGMVFNEPVDGWCVPEGIEALEFSYVFDQSIDKLRWPSTLTSLHLGHSFKQSLGSGIAWSASLRKLIIRSILSYPLAEVVFPSTLKHLEMPCSETGRYLGLRLPAGLEELYLGLHSPDLKWSELILPPGLKSLRLPTLAKLAFDGLVLPVSLEQLQFGMDFWESVEGSRPTRVSSLMALDVPSAMRSITVPDPDHPRLVFTSDDERGAYRRWVEALEARRACCVKRLGRS